MDSLLSLLRENARVSLEDAALQLDLSPEEVAAQIQALEDQGVIRAYQAIINDEKLADDAVTAVIEVNVTPEREGGFDHIASRISRYPEVTSMYLMSGQYDLMLFVEGPDLRTIANFVSARLSSIPGVTGTATHFRLKTYKHHGVLMETDEQYERLQVSP
ncbi:MAG: Lrp/AsnC family transcriptional regulator [Verrucomicrobia bacterium]|nr:Lrp/AsnC family transcriptional regulator [Verrucomicrobiota bacterium]MCH8512523.1 Lrp/AsnC family transcriptional regulator [Kiritimatiellia bacterium]